LQDFFVLLHTSILLKHSCFKTKSNYLLAHKINMRNNLLTHNIHIIRQIILLSLLLAGIFADSSAQQIEVYNKCGQLHRQALLLNNFNGNSQHSSRMLRDYAIAHTTHPDSLGLVFSCRQVCEVHVNSTGKPVIKIGFDDLVVKGTTSHKGFDFTDLLKPEAFRGKVVIQNFRNDTLYIYPFSGIFNPQKLFQYELLPGIEALNDSVWFEVSDLFFYHLPGNAEKLRARIRSIDEYQASSQLIASARRIMSPLNSRQPDLLPQSFVALLEASRILDHVSKNSLEKKLPLQHTDPLQLQRSLEIALNTHEFLSKEFVETLNKTSRIYLTQTEEEFVESFITSLSAYFNNNGQRGFSTGAFISGLSALDLNSEHFSTYKTYLRQIAAKINPHLQNKEASARVLSQIYNAMMELSKKLVAGSEYNQAIVMLENADRFCNSFEEIECSDENSRELAKARHGLYASYLSVANRATEANQLNLAMQYIELAREYQKNNSRLIYYDGDITIALIKLFDAYVVTATRQNTAQNYEAALGLLERAVGADFSITPTSGWHHQNSIALNGLLHHKLQRMMTQQDTLDLFALMDNYMEVKSFIAQKMSSAEPDEINSSLLSRWETAFLNNLVKEAEAGILIRDYEAVMELLFLSKNISRQPSGLKNRIESLSRNAGHEVIKQMLAQTVTSMNRGRTEEAFGLFYETVLRSEKYDLSGDAETKKQIDAVYDAYLSIRCIQVQSGFDQVLIYAQRLASSRMFDKAHDTINWVLQSATQYPACRLTLSTAKEFMEQYKHAAKFQKNVENAASALTQHHYEASFKYLLEAETLYNDHNLTSLTHESFSMIHFAEGHQSNKLLKLIAAHYAGTFRFEQSFAALALLKNHGIQASDLSDIQIMLGRGLGSRDRTEVGLLQSFSKARQYSGGGRWYNTFHRSYRRALGYRFP
jgi:hypothetical protein